MTLTAESLGVRVVRLRTLSFVVASFATALLVSVAGVIGFVGLMIPHLARGVAGSLHGRLAITCALFGAALLLGSDLAARNPASRAGAAGGHHHQLGGRSVRGGALAAQVAGAAVAREPRPMAGSPVPRRVLR